MKSFNMFLAERYKRIQGKRKHTTAEQDKFKQQYIDNFGEYLINKNTRESYIIKIYDIEVYINPHFNERIAERYPDMSKSDLWKLIKKIVSQLEDYKTPNGNSAWDDYDHNKLTDGKNPIVYSKSKKIA